MNDTRKVETGGVPAPIVERLRQLIRRTRTLIALRGVLAVVVTAAAALLAVMAIDAWTTILSSWGRWGLSLAAAAAVLATAWVFLVRPLVRSFSLAGIARAIEARHPELQERVSSAVELLSSTESEDVRGSDALIAALGREATSDLQAISPRREVTFRPLRPLAIAAVVLGAALVILLAVWPDDAGLLLARAVAPGANLPHVTAASLRIEPGRDVVVARGQRLEVRVTAPTRAAEQAELLVDAGGQSRTIEMAPAGQTDDGSPQFSHTFAAADESFAYRVRAGDGGASRAYRVHVVRRPEVSRLDLRVEYPGYTGREPVVYRDADGDIRAVAGSRVVVTAYSPTPVSDAELLVDGSADRVSPLGVDVSDGTSVCRFAIDLDAGLSGVWTLKLTRRVDDSAFDSQPIEHEIEATADQPPTATIVSPADRQLRLRRTDRLPVAYETSDDFGLAEAQVLLEADGKKLSPIRLGVLTARGDVDDAVRHAAGTVQIDLSTLELAGVSKLTCQLRSADSLPAGRGGPQEGFSALHTVVFDAAAPIYAVQVQLADELLLRETLRGVHETLTAARQDSAPLRSTMQADHHRWRREVARSVAAGGESESVRPPALDDESRTRIERIGEKLTGAEASLRDLVDRIAGGAYGPIADELAALTDNHVARAGRLVEQIPLTDATQGRYDQADEADFSISRAADGIADILERVDVAGTPLTDALQFAELSQRQAELADRRAQIGAAPEPATQAAGGQDGEQGPVQAMLERWRQAQAALAGELARRIGASESAMPMMARRDRSRTVDLAARARHLARRQADLATQTGDLDELSALDAQLAAVGERQTKLAAGAEALGEGQLSEIMSRAGKALADGRYAAGAELQDAALDGLQAGARGERRRQATGELAAKIAELATRQAELADKAAEASETFAGALSDAREAKTDKKLADERIAKAREALTAKLAGLTGRQEALVQRADAVEKSVARHPDLSGAVEAAPSQAMRAARGQIAEQTLAAAAKALEAARGGIDRWTRQIASGRGTAVARAEKSAEAVSEAERAAEKIGRRVSELQDATAEARRRAGATAERAEKLAAEATEAEEKAAAAEAAAARARENDDPDAEQKTAAAKQARARAEELRAQADAAAKQAAADKAQTDKLTAALDAAGAEQAVEQARLSRLQTAHETLAERSESAKQIAAQADELATAQKELADDLAKVQQGPAGQLAEAQQQSAEAASRHEAAGKAIVSARSAVNELTEAQQALAEEMATGDARMEDATGEAQQLAGPIDVREAMDSAAAAMQASEPAGAHQAAAEAGRRAKELGDRLAEVAPETPPAEIAARAMELEKLAAEQTELTAAAAPLIARRGQLADLQAGAQVTRLRAAQEAVADETVELSDRIKERYPQEDRLDTGAARAARDAAKDLGVGAVAESAGQASAAGAMLAALAARLGADVPAAIDPGAPAETRPEAVRVEGSTRQEPEQIRTLRALTGATDRSALGVRALELAARQQQIAAQLRALQEGRLAALASSRQEQIVAGTREVRDGASLIRQHAAQLLSEATARNHAERAVAQLDASLDAQAAAGDLLDQPDYPKARGQQTAAAEALTAAGDSLSAIGDILAARAAAVTAVSDEQELEDSWLVNAYEAAADAARGEDLSDAERAAKLLEELARRSSAAAGRLGVRPLPASQMIAAGVLGLSADASTGEAMRTLGDEQIERLDELGLTVADWAKLPGELQGEVLQSSGKRTPSEYRELIREYFRQVARRRDGGADDTPEDGQ